MASVGQQVRSANSVNCQNLANPVRDRGFISQNVLAQLRNLVDGLTLFRPSDPNEPSPFRYRARDGRSGFHQFG